MQPPNHTAPLFDDQNRRAATERLWKSYATINEWIRFADAKAGALLTFNGVVLGVALASLKDGYTFLKGHPLVFWLGVLLGVCLVVSALCAIECIRPRVKLTFGAGEAQQPKADTVSLSQIFFEEIAARSSEGAFRTNVMDTTSDAQAFNDICKQVYIVSRVASAKHRWIARSVWFLHAAVFVGL